MRCLVCSGLSFQIVCKHCYNTLLTPQKKIITQNSLEIHYFYNYSDIAPLLKTKHTPLGYKIYHLLARKLFANFQIPYTVLPIDYSPNGGYNHSAIIAKYASKKVAYAGIKAQNKVTYSGMSLKQRQANPRDFKVMKKGLGEVVLIDDIFTTATTLLEAKKVLEDAGIKTIFALSLAH